MKLLCIDATETRGTLLAGGIYTVKEAKASHYTLEEVEGAFKPSRFKVMEEPKIDNSLASPLIDEHNQPKEEEPCLPPDPPTMT